MYTRVAGVETERQLSDVAGELRDRYGDPPIAVQQLLRYAALRMKAVEAGVITIERKRDLVSIKFKQDAPIDPVKLATFVSSHRGSQFLPDGTLKFLARNAGAQELLDQLDRLLQALADQKASPVA
jgi:transcription-repair coupling factor (superfamily II helicase)